MSKFEFTLEECPWTEHYDAIIRVTPNLTGDEEGPLGLSIEKWEFIVKVLQERPGIDLHGGGKYTCALCMKYRTCTSCPIMRLTGKRSCAGTPYKLWMEEFSLAAAQAELEFLRGLSEGEYEYQITIDGETYEVHKMVNCGYLVQLICESPDGPTFYVARDSEAAGEAVRTYYLDMIRDSPNEFVCIVGSDNLISWGMGHWAGTARNLGDWLDQVANWPEQLWGTHDGTEYEIDQVSQDIVDDLGYTPSVAYRCG